MISQQKTRVQAIKSKFENLSNETVPSILKKNATQLNKQHGQNDCNLECKTNCNKENSIKHFNREMFIKEKDSDTSSDELPQPNMSYLYSKNDVKRSISETKKSLTRQISDPGKKLHRSHAFRCDRSQKIVSPQRHGSCNGRSETGDFSLKMGEKKLSKERLKQLGNLLEDQMRKENFIPLKNDAIVVGEVREVGVSPVDSIPDSDVPQHILDQYAKVIKPRKKEEKQDAMTDSGVSSETENLEEEKSGRIKKLMSQFQKSDTDLELKIPVNSLAPNDLCISSETIKLERKNPHLTLTDTLKKALKQPLPQGPPPKKPPRVFASSPIPESPEKQKKDTKKMLEKLEQVLQKREAQKNEYDVAETDLSIKKPKEIHYLCTEILDITQRTLLPNQNIGNCFKSLNCAIVTNNSTLSLPYTRLSTGSNVSLSKNSCSCSNDSLDKSRRVSSFLTDHKCSKCQENMEKPGFQCHLNCKCKKSKFFVDEHIYDEPFVDICEGGRRSKYGTLNHSKSMEDLRTGAILQEDQKIYDVPCDISRPETPEITTSSPKSSGLSEVRTPSPKALPKSDFEKLRQNFEKGFKDNEIKTIPENEVDGAEDAKPDAKKQNTEKPPMKPKPVFVKKVSKSTENLTDDTKIKNGDKKIFGSDTKRYNRKVNKSDVTSGIRLSLAKKENTQLDMDRENLNRLMNEIYETVTAACNMDDNKPASFPTEQSDGSEDSVKLTRSLTEKRKNYVRRVSSRVAYLDPKNIKTTRFRHQTSICSYKSEIIDNPYSTFRSWKCFRASQNNLTKDKMDLNHSDVSMATDDSSASIDNLSIDEKTGCVDIELPFVPREKGLFNVCLLVGLNYMTGQAYVKSVFPSQVQVPPHIENLIFPETLSSACKGEWSAEAKGAQCYSLVLTDERGERAYGYCRRVLPEGASTCLPLCYCLIGKYRAPGFYYKVLQEIESHHGSSDVEIHSILQQLFETDFPNPGEDITITYSSRIVENQLNISDKCKTMPNMRQSGAFDNSGVFDKSGVSNGSGVVDKIKNGVTSNSGACDKSGVIDRSGVSDGSGVVDSDKCTDVPEFYDLENNNAVRKVSLNLDGARIKYLKRPIEPRVDENNLSVLLDCLGAGLTIKVFGSLLLERKVLILGDKLSLVSSCMEALQAALYPFVWQQPLISTIPSEIQRDVLEAPLPILAGMLKTGDFDTSGVVFEEGMLIDLASTQKVIFYQGDESTILPTPSYKTLKTSLQMETKQRQDDAKTRNVMISEAFLRFFVDILGDFWKFFAVGELKEGGFGKGDVVFDKESYIKSATTKQNQYFLEWFTETAMFNHFIQNMAVTHKRKSSSASELARTVPAELAKNSTELAKNSTELAKMELVDTPLPDYYELFEERVRSRRSNWEQKCVESKSNYKNAMNKRVRLLKTKLRELVA